MADGKAAATGAPPSKAEDDAEYRAGVQAIKAKNYSTAVDTLSGVLERFVNEYGEKAPECADVYMQYGLALLREVEEREENANDVFGASVPREIATGAAPEGEAGEAGAPGEGSSSKLEGDDKQDEDGEEGEEGGEEGGEDKDNEDEGNGEEDEGEEEGKVSGKTVAEDSGDGKADAGGSGADDVTDDLQLAFEVLEVARMIMEKEDDESERLGDVYGYLGDVNLRNEAFDQALADYSSCLKIREATCRNDDDRLIEVHHLVSMVYSLVGGQTQNSILALRKAVQCCENRLKNLRIMLASEDDEPKVPEDSSLKPMTKPKIEATIIEVEEILEDLRGKIESEEVPNGLEGSSSSYAAAGGSSAGAAASLGLDAVKLLAAESGLMGAPAVGGSRGFVNEGFAGVPDSAPVKTLTVMSKKKRAEAAVAMTKTEGKRSTEDEGDAGSVASKRAKIDGSDASAAPTPARSDPAVEV